MADNSLSGRNDMIDAGRACTLREEQKIERIPSCFGLRQRPMWRHAGMTRYPANLRMMLQNNPVTPG